MKKKIIYIFVSLLFLGVEGCTKMSDFGDTNVNPAATSEPILSALMANVQSGLGGYAASVRPGLYGQYFSETQYTDASLYSLPQIEFSGEYAGPLQDLQVIIEKNESNNMTQVAKILQQYIFWTITDRWGDVPYSEALLGVKNANPKYDRQEDIYKGMIATLTKAAASFDASTIKGDLIYGGDAASWKRAANSMRMLMSLQLSKKFPAAGGYAASEFAKALADGGGYIQSNAQNMLLTFPGGNYKSNWFNLYNGRKDYGESKPMTDLMASLGDNRQKAFGGATQDQTAGNASETSSVGVPYGLVRAKVEAFTSANTNWARILRGDYRKENGSVVIISAGQIALARAEAANYGWTTENLSTVYSTGIALSHDQWGMTLPGDYLSQSAVALESAGAAGNLKKIAIQRYIAHYPDGMQAWNIWRKTGFPELTPAPDATNSSKQIPRRYTYGSTEFTSNKANVDAAVSALPGGDKQDSKVWWNN
ncbi:SusD/RagB family nutrient-binding outer membrane lipoprotein [Aquirufa sp. ROCK2-A2]